MKGSEGLVRVFFHRSLSGWLELANQSAKPHKCIDCVNTKQIHTRPFEDPDSCRAIYGLYVTFFIIFEY